MFCISFVVVTVRARLVDFDLHLEEAAADLGANEWVTFRKITLPLLAPAILAGGLLGFAISVDDFVITYFNSGSEITFPCTSGVRPRGRVPPQVNVIGSRDLLRRGREASCSRTSSVRREGSAPPHPGPSHDEAT